MSKYSISRGKLGVVFALNCILTYRERAKIIGIHDETNKKADQIVSDTRSLGYKQHNLTLRLGALVQDALPSAENMQGDCNIDCQDIIDKDWLNESKGIGSKLH